METWTNGTKSASTFLNEDKQGQAEWGDIVATWGDAVFSWGSNASAWNNRSKDSSIFTNLVKN